MNMSGLMSLLIWFFVLLLAPTAYMGMVLCTLPILVMLWKLSDQVERLIKLIKGDDNGKA